MAAIVATTAATHIEGKLLCLTNILPDAHTELPLPPCNQDTMPPKESMYYHKITNKVDTCNEYMVSSDRDENNRYTGAKQSN